MVGFYEKPMRTTDNLLSNVYFSCFELNFLERHHDVIKQKITMNSEKLCSVPTLCDPVDCSPPGSSVRGILQARIVEWAAISFSRGSSRPGLNQYLLHCRWILYHLSHQGSPDYEQRMTQSGTQILSPFLKTLEFRIGVCVWKKIKKEKVTHWQWPMELVNIDSLLYAFHTLAKTGRKESVSSSGQLRGKNEVFTMGLLRFRPNSLAMYYAAFPTLFC